MPPRTGRWGTIALTMERAPEASGELSARLAGARRISIISSASANGKTTLGRALATRLDVPFVELDALVHGPNWTETPDATLHAQLDPILARDGWVIDGQYLHKLGHRVLEAADVVLWLDLPVRVWLPRLVSRTLRRYVRREELWNGNRESLSVSLRGRDALFAYALRSHFARRREWPTQLAALPIVRVRSRAQAQAVLALMPSLASPPSAARRADRVATVPATFYWFAMSHPALAVRKMLELKGVPFRSVRILPGTQRAYLRLAGFRGGTVPAVVLDGRRIQGSRPIARALEQWAPEPALLPADAAQRARVEQAERWGEQELQNVPRILFRWGLVQDVKLRRWFGEDAGFPLPALAARVSRPLARYFARLSGADDGAARRALEDLSGMLDRVDALLADGTLSLTAPNVATFQVLCTVRALHAFTDLHELVDRHPAAQAAREVFPEYPGPVPRFIPRAWLVTAGAPA